MPYLYSADEIAALITATDTLRYPLRRATYRTLIGLLAVTGMRVGEAIRLDDADLDDRARRAHRDRQVRQAPPGPAAPEHGRGAAPPTSATAGPAHPHPSDPGVVGVHPGHPAALRQRQLHVRTLVGRAGLAPRSASCRPRPHDLRHSFAVATLLDWYRDGGDVEARLPLLSTYLGHVDPTSTYWYLQAAPELLALAAQRLDERPGAAGRDERARADPAGVLHRPADPAAPGQPAHHRRLPRHAAAAARLRRATHSASRPSRLDVADLDAPLIAAFLDHLEHDRGNSVRTRNARLAAIHSLFRFAALRHPEHAADIDRVLAIPPKRVDRALVTYLTEPELDALLAARDRAHLDRPPRPRPAPAGRPDRAAGLRADRAAPARDLHLGAGAHVSCHGKGRKDRITPLTRRTVAVLRAWTAERAGRPDRPAVPDPPRPAAVSRDALERRVAHHAAARRPHLPVADHQEDHPARPAAHRRDAAAARRRRHHRDRALARPRTVDTTQIYLHADLALKEQALDRTTPPTSAPGRYQPPDQLLAFLEAL